VLRRERLENNLQWMQTFARDRGLELAPHGKTTMSAQLFQRQLRAGAWGLTFATVAQTQVGVRAGARRLLIANQVVHASDLAAIARLLSEFSELRIAFLLDSIAQLRLIETIAANQNNPIWPAFEVLLEVGVDGGRTGTRDHQTALALARAAHHSSAVRLIGVECYEGLQASGDDLADTRMANALMSRVQALALALDQEQLFEDTSVVLSAGGSAIFDLVVDGLKTPLSRPVIGVLRSGCYVTHDQGNYKRLVSAVNRRLAIPACANELQAALEVWAQVQSKPELGLAILGVGKRDISYDIDLPRPLQWSQRNTTGVHDAPSDWSIRAMNDQHAYLVGDVACLAIGDRVVLGISHPCTTFDKWRWMPIVDQQYAVVDAISTCF
jgi:D-serine dehydratase